LSQIAERGAADCAASLDGSLVRTTPFTSHTLIDDGIDNTPEQISW
jgi:hypothetical protein